MSELISLEQLLAEVNVPPHMINLWTKKFPIFSPQRNADGKISFKTRDISFVKGLKHLLIHENENIKTVQAMLNEKGISYIIDIGKNPHIYKNQNASYHNNQNMRASFSASSTLKNKLSLSVAHKEIAKKAFSNLNSIFNKEKTAIPSDIVSEIPPEISPEIHNENIPQENHDVLDAVITQAPQLESHVPNFEENWRSLMEKKGKATPIEQVRDKPNKIHDDIENDIWFIDDEINLFDDESTDMPPLLPTVTHKEPIMQVIKNIPQTVQHSNNHQGLTIEKIEKMKHLIAKLDIMRDEMTSANSVITKTLKAFGYSSFENAYDKFDEKSAY